MAKKEFGPERESNLERCDETVKFYNIKSEPFRVYGFCSNDEFIRIPADIAEKSTVQGGNIEEMYRRTAGGRIRFRTNSSRIAVRVKTPIWRIYSTRTQQMVCGFDLYLNYGRKTEFRACLFPPTDADSEYERVVNTKSGEKEVTIYFPLFNEVDEVFVGIDSDAHLEKSDLYKVEKPVVFLGSSITQGANASRPGLCYEGIIERELDVNYVNLGFAGAFRAQEALVDYASSLDMSAFVLDYDHNAPTAEYLEKTHYGVYRKIRNKNPNIPIILVSKPDFRIENFEHAQRRSIIMNTYAKGIKEGDKKLYFVDGAAFFAGENRADCTEDNCHPNDAGFKKMAVNIGETLKCALADIL